MTSGMEAEPTSADQTDQDPMSALFTDLTPEQINQLYQAYQAIHGPKAARRLVQQKLGRIGGVPKVYHEQLLEQAINHQQKTKGPTGQNSSA